MTINASYKNKEDVIQEICNCIYGNALPFNVVRSPLCIQMQKAGGDYGKGWAKMYELLDNIVDKIEEEHVVQVVTNDASNLVAAGRMLMEKRTKLFWSPCAAHCLYLILEDIGEHPMVMQNHPRHIFMKQWTKLKRKLLKISKSKKQDIKKFGKLLTLGGIYNYTGLSMQLPITSNLDIAMTNFNPDSEVLVGLYETFQRIVLDIRTRVAIDQQLEKFKGAKGLFGMNIAIDTRNMKQPALLWESYGGEGKELQKVAMKILSFTCSVTGCERNWSTFDQVHTKRRNRLEQQRLNAPVYVKYNLQLEMRQKSREEKGETYDPICLSDIESDDD
ncbi:uncharacterized protein [Phaseolus vulgaris]|uniref:uncharacterized protein n=1 Tax=Phaseolus vulgaris TaxID=3885 RepID=UPI0035CBDD7A